MTDSVSSESCSCSDFSGPVTPACSPRLESLKIGEDIGIHLESYQGSAEVIASMAMKPSGISKDHNALIVPVISRVCFVGAGYVGGPTAAVIALYNPWLRVDVVDKSESRINRWKSRHLPIHEPGLEEIVRLARDGAIYELTPDTKNYQLSSTEGNREPNLFFSTDIAKSISQADMIFVAVNTPTKTFGRGAGRATDMSTFDACVEEVIQFAKPNAIIVEKSTVPCGSARRIATEIATRRPGVHLEVLSNPEFLSEGTAIRNLTEPDRVVIGDSRTLRGRAAAAALSQIYSWVPSDRILTANSWSSELSKLVANAMLAQRISSINTISALCEKTGADVNEISKIIGHDSRIGSKFIQAGLGYGGSCFRKDIASLTYLAESLGLDEVADYWSSVNTVNNLQRCRLAYRVIHRLRDNLAGKKITILGFAFKKGTADCRESLTADIVRMFLEERPRQIAIFDPICQSIDILQELISSIDDEQLVSTVVKVYSDPYGACMSADAVLIATDCDQFKLELKRPNEQPSCPNKLSEPLDTKDTFTATLKNPLTLTTTQRYTLMPLPPCAMTSCGECHEARRDSDDLSSHYIWSSPLARVHWPTVIRSMKSPARVFDARHVFSLQDVDELRSTDPQLVVEWIGIRP